MDYGKKHNPLEEICASRVCEVSEEKTRLYAGRTTRNANDALITAKTAAAIIFCSCTIFSWSHTPIRPKKNKHLVYRAMERNAHAFRARILFANTSVSPITQLDTF